MGGEKFIFGFEKLDLYKESKVLITEIYLLTHNYPENEKFGLVSQLRRAAVSVASNIAEGNSRKTSKERLHFMSVAYSSLMEVLCQLDISCDLGYITSEEFKTARTRIETIARLINGYKKYCQTK